MKLLPDSGLGEAGDDVYAALVAGHAGLSDADSLALNARLVLLLANELGDPGKVLAAIRAARASLVGSSERLADATIHPPPHAEVLAGGQPRSTPPASGPGPSRPSRASFEADLRSAPQDEEVSGSGSGLGDNAAGRFGPGSEEAI